MSSGRRSWAAALVGLALAGAGCKEKPTCPTGQVSCGGACIVADTVDNCVYCGNRCPQGASCTPSGCQCPTGETSCGYGQPCVSLSTDAKNCGACGHDCGLGTCTGRLCTCNTGTGILDCGPGTSPQCVDTLTDAKNCGACGHNCGLGTCTGGVCACNVGMVDCGSGTSPQCVNTLTDEKNCGGCGIACGSGETCSLGKCCATGWTNCSGACVNTSTDPSNCGACGNACGGGQTCSAGICCPSGWTNCSAACVNTSTDPSNCGACGTHCSASQTCSGAVCACAPATPLVCGSNCCAGWTCCSSNTCQLAHPNGLGQTYFACNPLGTPGDGTTYTATMAVMAGDAWAPGSSGTALTCGGGFCNAVVANGQCAVWCYQSMLAGYVHLDNLGITCLCPTTGDQTWN